jgi:hypothetical protein
MNLKTLLVLPLITTAAVFATGCAGPDLTIANPISAGNVPQNKIVKSHGFAESQRGLPDGAMSDEATIESVDKNQVCMGVSLHELSVIDLSRAEIKITSTTATLHQPKLKADPPSQQIYEGLVPHTEQTGTRLVCNKSSNGETVCETQPIYSHTMVRGPVDVFNTRGRLCAPNTGLITPETKDLALKISTPTASPGAWGYGHGSKSTTFRWSFR